MNPLKRMLIAIAVAAAVSAPFGAASAAPRLYCGFNLDRICRIICPKCAIQASTTPKTTVTGR